MYIDIRCGMSTDLGQAADVRVRPFISCPTRCPSIQMNRTNSIQTCPPVKASKQWYPDSQIKHRRAYSNSVYVIGSLLWMMKRQIIIDQDKSSSSKRSSNSVNKNRTDIMIRWLCIITYTKGNIDLLCCDIIYAVVCS